MRLRQSGFTLVEMVVVIELAETPRSFGVWRWLRLAVPENVGKTRFALASLAG